MVEIPEPPRVLVVEHERECPPGLWGGWLTEAGLRLDIVRPQLAAAGAETARACRPVAHRWASLVRRRHTERLLPS